MESYFVGLPLYFTLFVGFISLLMLIKSADFVIGNAVTVAMKFSISPLVIGTTIVAMSTSLAELSVNMSIATGGGDTSMILGNILGSNLVNIGIGLGIAALITPLLLRIEVIEKEFLLYFVVTAVITAFALSGTLTRLEGLFLIVMFVFILILIYQYAVREKNGEQLDVEYREETKRKKIAHNTIPLWKSAIYLFTGIIILLFSSDILVASLSESAKTLGISQYIIGLTIVGIGTSFPELATSFQAAKKGYVDLILGNVFGSNVFNICIALGLPLVFHTIRISTKSQQDFYFINIFGLIVALILLLDSKITGKNREINRNGGFIIFAIYIIYLSYKISVEKS